MLSTLKSMRCRAEEYLTLRTRASVILTRRRRKSAPTTERSVSCSVQTWPALDRVKGQRVKSLRSFEDVVALKSLLGERTDLRTGPSAFRHRAEDCWRIDFRASLFTSSSESSNRAMLSNKSGQLGDEANEAFFERSS